MNQINDTETFCGLCDKLKSTYANHISFYTLTGQTSDIEPLINMVDLLRDTLLKKSAEFKELEHKEITH